MGKIKSNPKETGYDWALFPQFYFLSAKILCKKLQDSANPMTRLTVKKPFLGGQICNEYGLPGHPNYHLIFPIVFNLKHGIELYMKSLSNLDRDKYLQEHDYKRLFNDLIDNVNNKKNKPVFEKLKRNIWPIIRKYYFGTFIPGNIEWGADSQNQAERYPHREDCYKLPFNYDWVTEDLVAVILNDIDLLQKFFRETWIKVARNDPLHDNPANNTPDAFAKKIMEAGD